MRSITTAVVLVGVMAAPLGAQGRYGRVPPGQMPPPGACRVWYDGVPPGQQPRAMNCRDAERLAARSRNARVIYGDDARTRNRDRDVYRSQERNRDRRADRYDDRYPYERYGYGVGSVPYQNGHRDGYEKGREDARDRDSYDPVRHSRYRSADRGYESRYGSKDQYKLVYREGFEAGYDQAYRETRGDRRIGSGGIRVPFPF